MKSLAKSAFLAEACLRDNLLSKPTVYYDNSNPEFWADQLSALDSSAVGSLIFDNVDYANGRQQTMINNPGTLPDYLMTDTIKQMQRDKAYMDMVQDPMLMEMAANNLSASKQSVAIQSAADATQSNMPGLDIFSRIEYAANQQAVPEMSVYKQLSTGEIIFDEATNRLSSYWDIIANHKLEAATGLLEIGNHPISSAFKAGKHGAEVGEAFREGDYETRVRIATDAGVDAALLVATDGLSRAVEAGMTAFKTGIDGYEVLHMGVVSKGSGISASEYISQLRSPAKRHYVNGVTQKSLAKETNTVVLSSVDVGKDVSMIKNGLAEINGDTFTVNNRTYGHHDGTLYPISGDGLFKLDRGAYKALGVYNRFGNTTRASLILDNMRVPESVRQEALRAWGAEKLTV